MYKEIDLYIYVHIHTYIGAYMHNSDKYSQTMNEMNESAMILSAFENRPRAGFTLCKQIQPLSSVQEH